MKRKGGFPAVLLGALLMGCATAVFQPTEQDLPLARTRWPSATLEELQRGRGLYVERCAGCHQLKRPEERSPDGWAEVMDEMAQEADLERDERHLIEQFLATASARARALAPAAEPPASEPPAARK